MGEVQIIGLMGVGSRESGVGSRELTRVGFLHLGPAPPPTPDRSGADHKERKRKTTKKGCSAVLGRQRRQRGVPPGDET
ncbi:MAG: hypothetical protein F6K55_32130 [Moorea sp. SIO4A3]|nr:hypothetical protein [Moorena sp. SIO4A3]